MVQAVLDDVRDLPPSAKLVFKVLEWEGELTQQQLIKETRLPPRTVRHALTGLEDNDVIEKRFSFYDARQRRYAIQCPGKG